MKEILIWLVIFICLIVFGFFSGYQLVSSNTYKNYKQLAIVIPVLPGPWEPSINVTSTPIKWPVYYPIIPVVQQEKPNCYKFSDGITYCK